MKCYEKKQSWYHIYIWKKIKNLPCLFTINLQGYIFMELTHVQISAITATHNNWNLKLIFTSLVGSITSCCLGKEPVLLPQRHGWMREDSFVSLSQSDNCPQIFVRHKSMHKLFGQIIVNKMVEDVELIALARERIFETFQIESLRFSVGSVRNVSQHPRCVEIFRQLPGFPSRLIGQNCLKEIFMRQFNNTSFEQKIPSFLTKQCIIISNVKLTCTLQISPSQLPSEEILTFFTTIKAWEGRVGWTIVSRTWITSSGFGLGQISPYDKLFADLKPSLIFSMAKRFCWCSKKVPFIHLFLS